MIVSSCHSSTTDSLIWASFSSTTTTHDKRNLTSPFFLPSIYYPLSIVPLSHLWHQITSYWLECVCVCAYQRFICPERNSSIAHIVGTRKKNMSNRDNNLTRSPFFADGELYSGTTADFSGSDALIYRDNIRTEQNDLRHLNGKPHISSGSLRNFPNIRRMA